MCIRDRVGPSPLSQTWLYPAIVPLLLTPAPTFTELPCCRSVSLEYFSMERVTNANVKINHILKSDHCKPSTDFISFFWVLVLFYFETSVSKLLNFVKYIPCSPNPQLSPGVWWMVNDIESTFPFQRNTKIPLPTRPPTKARKNEFNMKYENCSMMLLILNGE